MSQTEQHEQNLHDLELIRTDPAWALTAVQSWRRAEAENRELREERNGLREVVHQWLGAYQAGYFDNLNRTRRDTVREIRDTSNKALGA